MVKIQVLQIKNKESSEVWTIEQFEGSHGALMKVPVGSALWRKNASYHSLESAFNALKKNIRLDEDFYILESHNGRVKASLEVTPFAVILKVNHMWKESFGFKNKRAAFNHFLSNYTLKNGI